MEYFDMKKKFERIFVEGGESDGAMIVKGGRMVEECKPRTKKGCQYVEDYLNAELNEIQDSDMNVDSLNMDIQDGISDLDFTSRGTFSDPHELHKDKIHGIYKAYYEGRQKPATNLIISDYKKKILSFIETNEVVVLSGPTGCGKTTQVPQYILDSHIEKNKYCNIVVTQPRRIAAISIAKRVSEERGWELGKLCGYKVGLKDSTSDHTLLTYMTVGVLLQTLIKKKSLMQYTHIILDEIHERDQSMDFALIIVKKLLSLSQHVKVILMSATVEAMKFSNYFQKSYSGVPQGAPVIKINQATNFTVQIHYLDELSALGDLPEISSKNPTISEKNFEICIRLIKQFEKIDNDPNKKNSVLIFLPGIFEIEQLYTKLTDPNVYTAGSVHYKWSPLPLHSSITTEEQSQVFLPAPAGYRKIILSTNIAESSITVPGVKFVIDFCLTKRLQTDAYSSFTSLHLHWASQANCIQRAGRVGRVMEGRVYRMVYKDFYEDLEKETLPDMLTSPLENVVLQSKMLNMGEPKAILAMALDPPDLSNIEWTILLLKEAGGLLRTRRGEYTPFDGDLTFLGRLMAILPVDIQITRLIIMGHIFSCLEECIIMGACLSLKSLFSHPFKNRLKAYTSKLSWADGSCSDCIAYLNVYEVWRNNHMNGYFKRSKGDSEVNWAKRHFIQLRVLKEVQLLVEEITLRLKENHIEESVGVGKVVWNEYQKALVLKLAIAGAFYPKYFGRGMRGGQVDEATAVKVLGGRDPFTTVYLSNFPSDQPVQLYSRLIQEELSDCHEEMKITSDGTSKVYVEFRKRDSNIRNKEGLPFDGTLPGKISTAVYRAVKLRHVKRTIRIKILPDEEARRRAASLGVKYRRPLFDQEAEPEEKWEGIQCNLPGLHTSHIYFFVSHVCDPGHFWGYDVSNFDIQLQIFHMLNISHRSFLKPLNKVPDVGDICIAPFKEFDETWFYRARVESVNRQGPKTLFQVFYIDHGSSAVVGYDELRKTKRGMPDTIKKTPALVFECALSELGPSLIRNPKGTWSRDACLKFEKLTYKMKLVGIIYSVVNGVISMQLYKADDNGYRLNINKYLVDEGFAEIVEESYLSKKDNENRKLMQTGFDMNVAFKALENHRFWDSSSLEPPAEKDRNITVELRGPVSPLEMKIYPYTRGALTKTVSVCDESVNSVLLDTDPQDPHERLIVAGFLNENAEGSRLILNCTTVMPNIHGLATIIPFIFAPEIELRTNAERTRYTGMLCGLGTDDTGNPILPEHDFEIYFDTEITCDDFITVNGLRYFMSMLLLTEEGEPFPNLSFPDIVKFQRKIQSNLLRLLSKQRKSKEFEASRHEHKWGMFESDFVVDNPVALSYNSIFIFRLHPGLSIDPSNET